MVRLPVALMCVAVLASSVPSSLAGPGEPSVPPRPGSANTSLNPNATATLWSRDDDTGHVTGDQFRNASMGNRSAMAQLANGTDITFSAPPSTAATWTREDFHQIRLGGENTSVYPPNATLTDSAYIRDAHATIFAVQPSTKAHRGPDRTTWYVAPSGTVRGVVDYRVAVPRNGSAAIDDWQALDARIDTVRLLRDGEPIATVDGTHEPVLRYRNLTGYRANLTLEAEIVVTARRPGAVGNDTTSVTLDRVDVRDTIETVVYRPQPRVERADYPGNATGVAVYTSRPWQGYVTASGRVRGVWRFYTARNARWDRLRVANATDVHTRPSAALPVYVHAYPSRIGPRAEPTGDGPRILRTWGPTIGSPAPTIGRNVTVGVVNRSYNATYGLAARHPDPVEYVRVLGIVRGVTRTVPIERAQSRAVRRSDLTVSVIDHTDEQATLRVTLRDDTTGEPIVLADPDTPRRESLVEAYSRSGYVTVAGQRVRTNASGVATVTVEQAGVYRATYRPESWLHFAPAYARATAMARWHPLMTLGGWLSLLETLVVTALPFAVALYAGRKLGTIFQTPYR